MPESLRIHLHNELFGGNFRMGPDKAIGHAFGAAAAKGHGKGLVP